MARATARRSLRGRLRDLRGSPRLRDEAVDPAQPPLRSEEGVSAGHRAYPMLAIAQAATIAPPASTATARATSVTTVGDWNGSTTFRSRSVTHALRCADLR